MDTSLFANYVLKFQTLFNGWSNCLISLKRANNIFVFCLNKTCLLLFLVSIEETSQRMHQTNRLSLKKKFHGLHNKTVCKKLTLRQKPQRRVNKEFIMNKWCTFNVITDNVISWTFRGFSRSYQMESWPVVWKREFG